MRTCRMFVRGPDGADVGEIKIFSKAEFVLRGNDVSAWTVEGTPHGRLLDLAEPGSELVVERWGEELISGPLDMDERKWEAGTDSIDLSGFSQEIFLSDYIGYPSARVGTSGAIFPGNSHHVVSGTAEAVMKNVLTANAITAGAFSDGRVIPDLSVATNLGRGESVTARVRFQTLLELFQELAISGGNLGFFIRQHEFDVYQREDRRDDVVFSKNLKNLWGYETKRQAPEGTHWLVAGQGEMTARQFLFGGDQSRVDTWHRRIEVFRDRRDTEEMSEMQQTLDEELFEAQEIFEAKLRIATTAQQQFGRDFFLGDLVTVAEQPCIINEVKITLDQNGEEVVPAPSTSPNSAEALLQIYDSVRNLQRQISALQRSN